MPIPLIVAGLSAVAGIIGAGGHLSAKETNEKAQRVSENAQDIYNCSKYSLEKEKNNTENALLKFGYAKKKILDCSMKQFLHSYEKIKSIEVVNSVGLDEISNYVIDQEEAIQIREMTDIYSSTISSGATGAAAGAIIVLAANGSLSVVTGVLSIAGSTLAMGEIGAAASIAGSALSFGASMTPLAAIAAPVVLFTGLSASIKADENLEKAQSMYAEATAAAEKMKVSETLCVAIANRSDMFNDLLFELDGMFSECASMLEAVVQKKSGFFGRKKIKTENLTEEELKLIAVTRALAGAVKSIIDTPILSDNGAISVESEDIFNQITYKSPVFSKTVKEIESYDYKVKPKKIKQSNECVPSNNNLKREMPNVIRNVFAIVLGLLAALLFTDALLKGVLVSTMLSLFIIKWNGNDKELKTKTNSKIHKKSSIFLKRLAIVTCGICLINTILPSNADITTAPISEYVEKAVISDQSIEKIDLNQTVAPIIPATDVPTEGVLTIENEVEETLFENALTEVEITTKDVSIEVEISTEAEVLAEVKVSPDVNPSIIPESIPAVLTNDLTDIQKEYSVEFSTAIAGITIEKAYAREEIIGMGIRDYKAEEGLVFVFISYSIRKIEGESYLLNGVGSITSLKAPDGSVYSTYPEATLAARKENDIDSFEILEEESAARRAVGFCVPKKWVDENAIFYLGNQYDEKIPVKFQK